MERFFNISPEENLNVSHKSGKSNAGSCSWVLKHLITIMLTIFLLMMVTPLNASPGSDLRKKSGCRAKQMSFSYPVIMKKHNPVLNKKHYKQQNRKKTPFHLYR